MGGGEGSSSSPEGSSDGGDGGGGGGITEYELRRLSRIRENRARLEALGLPRLASSAAALSPPPPPSSSSSSKQRDKKRRSRTRRRRKSGGDSEEEDDDEEYRPSDGDRGDDHDSDEEVEGGDGSGSSSSYSAGEEEAEEEEEEDVRVSSCGSRRKGKKEKFSNSRKGCKSSCVEGNIEKPDDFVDEDAALEQAIALSLGGVAENPVVSGGLSQKSGTKESETGGKRKTRKVFKSRIQLSEDEVVAYFFLFDEIGKGHMSVRDLQRMALAHDFAWTDSEIATMVHSFDSDGDGKLSLEDFRAIVSRCNMMHET